MPQRRNMMTYYWKAEIASVFTLSLPFPLHRPGISKHVRSKDRTFSFWRKAQSDWTVEAWFCRLHSGEVASAHLNMPTNENSSSTLHRHWGGSEQPDSMFMQSKFSHQLMGIVWEQEFSEQGGCQDLDLYQMPRRRLCFLSSQLEVGCCETASNAKTVGKWARQK